MTFKITLRIMLYVLLAAFIVVLVWFVLKQPSNEGDWALDQAVLPYVDLEGETATVHNIRNFTYRSTTDYTPAYYDATYDLRALERVYFIIEPFSGYKGAAHTFLSFEFSDGRFLAASVEIRKEKGETFKAFRGLFKQYELMYVLADERDVVKLRSNYRHDEVYVYPIATSKERIRAALLSIFRRVNKLHDEPEFYNTLTNTCTTNLARHANEVVKNRVPWNLTLLFPAESDRYAFDLGLIDTKLTDFAEVRRAHHINDLALAYVDDPEFSLRIRGR